MMNVSASSNRFIVFFLNLLATFILMVTWCILLHSRHGFLSYLVKSSMQKKKYTIYGYKGKQVRDNIHSEDLVNCFWNFFKKPRIGEAYNIGGGRKSNCSIIEAINYVELLTNINVKKTYKKENRVGDHIWYISNTKKFRNHFPNWKQKYGTNEIIEELVEVFERV